MKVFVNQVTIPKYSIGIIIVSANNVEEANNIIINHCKEYTYNDNIFDLTYTKESKIIQTNVHRAGVLYSKIREE